MSLLHCLPSIQRSFGVLFRLFSIDEYTDIDPGDPLDRQLNVNPSTKPDTKNQFRGNAPMTPSELPNLTSWQLRGTRGNTQCHICTY